MMVTPIITTAQTVDSMPSAIPERMVVAEPDKFAVLTAAIRKELAEAVPDLTTTKGRDAIKARAAAVNADPGAFETRHRSRYPGEISDRNEPGTERFQDGADGLSEAEGAPRTGTVAKELPGTGGAIPRLCHEEELPVPGGNAQAVGVVIKKDRHRGELSPSVRSS